MKRNQLHIGLTLCLVVLLVACGQQGRKPVPAKPKTQSTAGVTGEYFPSPDFAGAEVTRIDPTLDFDWGYEGPAEGIGPGTYTVRWTGQIYPSFSETYTFHLTHTDGARLMVNGRVVVNNWAGQGEVTDSGTVPLVGGGFV